VVNRKHVMTFLVVLVLAALAQAQTFSTLYNFTDSSDGGYPLAGVIQGKAGNLYGTTEGGGSGYGVVWGLTSAGTETALYSFTGGSDGSYPYGGVVRDHKGNLYGTTYYGGANSMGVVFKVSSSGTETVLHTFAGGTSDGQYPFGGLVMDKSGSLYGMTDDGGANSEGTIYKVTSKGKFTLLHSFAGSDGEYPFFAVPIIDSKGDLYGVTDSGGSGSQGVVWKLSKKGVMTVLHSFAGGTSDGCYPYGRVAMDSKGNLYGTTDSCGTSSYGTIWKVSKKGTETILHNFAGATSDGAYPESGVVRDSKGNLFGCTYYGGANSYYGTVYELSKSGTLTLLHSFDYSDGGYPYGDLLDVKGTLYGTTDGGGSSYAGTVWSYVP